MVKISCHVKSSWIHPAELVKKEVLPTQLPARPQPGDYIRALFSKTEFVIIKCTWVLANPDDKQMTLELELE